MLTMACKHAARKPQLLPQAAVHCIRLNTWQTVCGWISDCCCWEERGHGLTCENRNENLGPEDVILVSPLDRTNRGPP